MVLLSDILTQIMNGPYPPESSIIQKLSDFMLLHPKGPLGLSTHMIVFMKKFKHSEIDGNSMCKLLFALDKVVCTQPIFRAELQTVEFMKRFQAQCDYKERNLDSIAKTASRALAEKWATDFPVEFPEYVKFVQKYSTVFFQRSPIEVEEFVAVVQKTIRDTLEECSQKQSSFENTIKKLIALKEKFPKYAALMKENLQSTKSLDDLLCVIEYLVSKIKRSADALNLRPTQKLDDKGDVVCVKKAQQKQEEKKIKETKKAEKTSKKRRAESLQSPGYNVLGGLLDEQITSDKTELKVEQKTMEKIITQPVYVETKTRKRMSSTGGVLLAPPRPKRNCRMSIGSPEQVSFL
ncbi:hypothetical protein EIN_183020 [Entamoeba invadens IP1]|uniref:hypothetical protein n=1 Tax=Entamoeba invadens IP1 TaxID=370355 RepID=UPI0002C3E822|nr:hypothetical protein EIN_183020 [Entamoeba invadens IP1]ELP94045.1 hypothetical protein EIN_183020 [Entamoeba invadens IP1]|eukprot:XP_004260816.1 hypothetical protein EIN_183020 [Entamoeba invadens IP1]